ncbi:MAG: DUF1800 domain-containing protein [Saprospiraceae bacterium]
MASPTTMAAAVTTGLAPYTGPWTAAQAAHLLRRTGCGPRRPEIEQVVIAGLSATLVELFATQPVPAPPVNHYFESDPLVAIGEPWVDKALTVVAGLANYRRQSLSAWVVQQAENEGISVREKMTLFWTNHFGITVNNDQRVNYEYNRLLREYATGNARQLVKEVTLNVAMLIFLNGNQNSKNSPNENYGRELMELFTLGKGPQVGPGDYTNYTEDDVRAAARVLTGWRTRYINSTNPDNDPESYYTANRHDSEDKQFSERFGNAVISNGGDQEYAQLVDLIFDQPATARYLVTKLYRFFVYYDITPTVESEVIAPLAQLLIDNDYEIAPVLQALLGSQHFYDIVYAGPMIRSPWDYTINILRQFGYDHLEENLERDTHVRFLTYNAIALMDQEYFKTPSVAGWKAYYQAPGYYRSWISGPTLQARANMVGDLTRANGLFVKGVRYRFNYVAWIEQFGSESYDPNTLIQRTTQLLLPQPALPEQLDSLKEILLPGLPDFEWTDEYGLYLTDPTNEMLYAAIDSKLRELFKAIFNMAEFHLS